MNLKVKFEELRDNFLLETQGQSYTDYNHPSHKEIVSMGKEVIPFLLEELKVNRGHWFTALYMITGEDPVSEQDKGRVRKMIEHWLEWGKNNGYCN